MDKILDWSPQVNEGIVITQNLRAFKSHCETLAFICKVRITIFDPICDAIVRDVMKVLWTHMKTKQTCYGKKHPMSLSRDQFLQISQPGKLLRSHEKCI